MAGQGLRVTIWNEHVHEREDARVAAIYPDGSTARSRRRWRGIPGVGAPAGGSRRPAGADRGGGQHPQPRDGRGRDRRRARRRLGRGGATL